MKGYQYLENDFFDLCKTRKIHRIPMLLYIYLRGLYCRFQKPLFFYFDRHVREHLGMSQSTLSRARNALQEKGLITFQSGIGNNPTQYTMLGTTLLPIVKKTTPSRQNQTQGYRQNDDTNSRVKKELRIKHSSVITRSEATKQSQAPGWQREALKAIRARNERKKRCSV